MECWYSYKCIYFRYLGPPPLKMSINTLSHPNLLVPPKTFIATVLWKHLIRKLITASWKSLVPLALQFIQNTQTMSHHLIWHQRVWSNNAQGGQLYVYPTLSRTVRSRGLNFRPEIARPRIQWPGPLIGQTLAHDGFWLAGAWHSTQCDDALTR